jgi:hypothetical protein
MDRNLASRLALAIALLAPAWVVVAQQTAADIQESAAAAKTRLRLTPDQEQIFSRLSVKKSTEGNRL